MDPGITEKNRKRESKATAYKVEKPLKVSKSYCCYHILQVNLHHLEVVFCVKNDTIPIRLILNIANFYTRDTIHAALYC